MRGEQRRSHRCNIPTGRIRACDGSSLAAKFEVLVSPARPRTIFTANESLPSQGAGFLNMCHDYMHTSCDTLCRRRLAAQPAIVIYHRVSTRSWKAPTSRTSCGQEAAGTRSSTSEASTDCWMTRRCLRTNSQRGASLWTQIPWAELGARFRGRRKA